jgi:hypothetical protein
MPADREGIQRRNPSSSLGQDFQEEEDLENDDADEKGSQYHDRQAGHLDHDK